MYSHCGVPLRTLQMHTVSTGTVGTQRTASLTVRPVPSRRLRPPRRQRGAAWAGSCGCWFPTCGPRALRRCRSWCCCVWFCCWSSGWSTCWFPSTPRTSVSASALLQFHSQTVGGSELLLKEEQQQTGINAGSSLEDELE